MSKMYRAAVVAFTAALITSAAQADGPNTSAQGLLSAWKGEDPNMRMVTEVIASAFASGLSWKGTLERHPNRLNRSGDSRIGFDLIQASAGLEAGREGRAAFHGSSQTCVGRDCCGCFGSKRGASLWSERAERQPVAGA